MYVIYSPVWVSVLLEYMLLSELCLPGGTRTQMGMIPQPMRFGGNENPLLCVPDVFVPRELYGQRIEREILWTM